MKRYKITVFETRISFTTVAAENKREASKIVRSFLDDGSYWDMAQNEEGLGGKIQAIEEIK